MNHKNFLAHLEQLGWIVEQNIDQPLRLDEISIDKLKCAGTEFEELVTSYFACSNQSDDVWFLSWADYAEKSDSSFSWNEFELQSLEAALDESQKNQVVAFWSKHVPFLVSVRSGYSYIAMSIDDSTFGRIVTGNEPEYEETVTLSNSLTDFYKHFLDALTGKVLDPKLTPFA